MSPLYSLVNFLFLANCSFIGDKFSKKQPEDNDKQDLEYNINRSLHDRYVLVHEQLFNRKTKDYLSNLVDKFIKEGEQIRNSPDGKEITSLLDTYSLGMTFPITICKIAKKYGKMKQLKQYILSDKVKSFMDLFKHMTEPDHLNRMKPKDVYDKYIELEKLYLSKKKTTKKRTKRK